MDFDTELFILEIKERPAIWDSNCADYSDRNNKLKCWEEVIDIYAKEDDTEEDKQELGKVLMKKWRNIRDNFVKASKNLKNMKSSSGGKHKSPYKYYNTLLFLKDSIRNDTDSDISNDSSKNTDGRKQKRKKKTNKDAIEQQLVSVLSKKLEYKKEKESDDDKLFLLSLLSEFKKIPESNKLDARCEIIRVIKNAQKP
ncbi:hypothetical protein PYW08_005971 [Mythimna loreyi]|uniref:Uncharacterized protein n=1 Tax=Mythimna loreyi TaxID=667449 RepID=A0ACC2QLQ1_9NEOP|nr:hypothetical protein PYW08_005971 [Mythimna loreyi]